MQITTKCQVVRSDWNVRSMCMECDWSKYHSSNICDIFWVNQVQIVPKSKEGGEWEGSCGCDQISGEF